MQLLIQWPYSLYDEGYCAVIVRHDGDMATLLEQAVYAVGRHSDSGMNPLLDARGRMQQPPYSAVHVWNMTPCPTCGGTKKVAPCKKMPSLNDFALYKDGAELPRTGTLAEAGIADRDWLTLDYVVRDRFGKGKPASEKAENIPDAIISIDGATTPEELGRVSRALNGLLSGNAQVRDGHTSPVMLNLSLDSILAMSHDELRALIQEEIKVQMRKTERDN